MNYNEINNKLQDISIENNIWVIYIGIIIASWYSNNLEKKYFVYDDLECKEKYRKVMIGIFTILVIIYFYFLKSSTDDINNLKINDTAKKKRLTYMSSLGSFLIVMSGIIFLYIAIADEDIDVEIAFN